MDIRTVIADHLLDIGAVKIVDPDHLFTWVSGIRSPIYCDNRMTISYPEVRNVIAEGFAARIRALYPQAEVIAGTATAGIPHAAWVAQILGLPMVYVRSASKEHGRGRQVEGVLNSGAKVVLIEDLVSTGGSSVGAIEGLRAEGADVLGCLAIFSYGFPKAADTFAKASSSYESLTTYPVMLERARERGYIADSLIPTLLAWSENPYLFTEKA